MERSKKPRCKTSGNAHLFPVKGEKNNKPSLTVPDQTMSLRELLHRHTRGLPLHHVERPTYYDEEETIDLKTLDLTEIQDLKDAARENVERLQAQARAEQARGKQAREEQAAKKQRAQASPPEAEEPADLFNKSVGNAEGAYEKPSPPAMRHE